MNRITCAQNPAARNIIVHKQISIERWTWTDIKLLADRGDANGSKGGCDTVLAQDIFDFRKFAPQSLTHTDQAKRTESAALSHTYNYPESATNQLGSTLLRARSWWVCLWLWQQTCGEFSKNSWTISKSPTKHNQNRTILSKQLSSTTHLQTSPSPILFFQKNKGKSEELPNICLRKLPNILIPSHTNLDFSVSRRNSLRH